MKSLRFALGAIPFLFVALVVRPAVAGDIDVEKINREAKGKWRAVENKMTRLTPEERKARLGLQRPSAEALAAREAEVSDVLALAAEPPPGTFDWRFNGGNFVTPVRDQGGCGSCWAFAAAAVLESKVLISQNTPGQALNLSEETLIACQGPTGGEAMPNDCTGGSLYDAALYLRNRGLPPESCYPYDLQDWPFSPNGDAYCAGACDGWRATSYRIDSFIDRYPTTASNRVNLIKRYVQNYGPTAVALDVYNDFYTWGGGGAYQKTPSATYQGGHAVVVVGWDDAGQHFIAKNSWGTDWGEDGFLRIAYDQTTGPVGFGWWISAYGNAYRHGVLADLRSEGFSAPGALATSGTPFSVEARIVNAGTADAGSSTAKLWLAKDADGVVTDDWLAGSMAVPALAVGAEALVSWAFDAPTLAAVPRGVRPVVVVDSAKAVEELNEANKFAAADPLFTLEPPVWVQVASPNGGDSWTRGQPVAISWTHRACTAVEIRLRRRTSTGWATRVVASGVPAGDGTYPWTVPENLFRSAKYKVQVLCADDAAALDLSNRYFTVQ